MNVKKRLTKEVVFTGITFVLLVVLVNIFFFLLSGSINDLMEEANPSLRAMEHMLTEVSQGSVYLLDYMQAESSDTLQELDSIIMEVDDRCTAIEDHINELIAKNAISDHYIVSDYESARALFYETKSIRDEIIALRRQEVVQGMNHGEEMQQLIFVYQLKMQEAHNRFSDGITKLNTRNELLNEDLRTQTRTYFIVMVILSIAFMVTLVYRMRKISKEFIDPIDATISTTKQFVDGDHEAQIKDISKIHELSDLQYNINKVMGVISGIANQSEQEKEKIETQLLRREYTEILDYLNAQVLGKRQISITDLKKHLHVTHPTVLSRIKFLEKRGYIVIEKDGREKFLIPTKKAQIAN